MEFELDEQQVKKYLEWSTNHKCKVTDVGAIGGKDTFEFTITSIGCIVVVKCACGKKINLTDYESW